MWDVSQESLDKLQQILEKEYGRTFTKEQVKKYSDQLLSLGSLIYTKKQIESYDKLENE